MPQPGKHRVQIAPRPPGLRRAPRQERRLGVPRRPLAFVTGSVRGRGLPRRALFWQSRAGPRAPTRPRLPGAWGRWGWGQLDKDWGSRRSIGGHLRTWDFVPSLLYVIESSPFEEEDRAAREEGQRERGPGCQPETRARCSSQARARGFVCMQWMDARMHEDNRRIGAHVLGFWPRFWQLQGARGRCLYPAPPRSTLEVLWGRGWALWTRGLLTERAVPRGGGLWRGTKRQTLGAIRGQARTGTHARTPPRAPPHEPRLR